MEIKKVALVAASTMLLSTAALAGEPKGGSCTPGYWKNHEIVGDAVAFCEGVVGDLEAYLWATGQDNPGDGSPGDSKWEAASCLNAWYNSDPKSPGLPCEDPIDGRDD